ncbi:hypothetical protein Tco_0820331 [Tanacetum coccineum]|uniref:Uncharacterized protein n=1 Tax=Tanacetum coccineum TaxID=301880 RepID=A0ABQ5ABP5_9ASTR
MAAGVVAGDGDGGRCDGWGDSRGSGGGGRRWGWWVMAWHVGDDVGRGGRLLDWPEVNTNKSYKDDIDEEDDESSTMEPPSRNEAIKAAITLNNFLLSYEKTTPEVLTMLRKIRDEIQGEIDFNKKQKTIESFFKKPS